MKLLVIDQYAALLDFCMQAKRDGHDVRWWIPRTAANFRCEIGDGFVDKVTGWTSHAKWADLIVTATNQKYMRDISPFFSAGYPIFGCNPVAAELELDRGLGQRICDDYGIETIPFEIFTSYSDACKHVERTMETFVCKPWGGAADKDKSYVSKSPEDMILKLTQWEKEGRLKGQIMLQEKVKGIEMAVGGWFGKGGWNSAICENFEEKKFMNDNLGRNTGEQGTTLRYVERSKLFEQVLEPVTGYLHKIGYVGYVDQNTMVDRRGRPFPLEFTMRFGYPLRDIQSALHLGDSVTWMHDLLNGRDTLRVKPSISVGVVMSHGEYPNCRERPQDHGVPLYGWRPGMTSSVHFVAMKLGQAPRQQDGKIKWSPFPVSSGAEMVTVTGTGETVREAQEAAYAGCWKLEPPTNVMFRTDISKRLKEQLPELQSHGFATGMRY